MIFVCVSLLAAALHSAALLLAAASHSTVLLLAAALHSAALLLVPAFSNLGSDAQIYLLRRILEIFT